MDISQIGGTFGVGGSNVLGGSGNENPFLELVVTELQNQNPLEPTSITEFLGQLAQFSTLEQLEVLNNNLTQQAVFSQFGQAANLVGKDVTYFDQAGESQRGRVDSVAIQGSNVFVDVNGETVLLQNVSRVHADEVSTDTTDSNEPPGDGDGTSPDQDTDSES